MVRESSVTVVSAAKLRIPFRRSSRLRRFPWRCHSWAILEQTMAMRKREVDEICPRAAGIDVGGSGHWVVVPAEAAEDPVREFGAMTDDLHAMADWLLQCSVDTVALESTSVQWIPVYEMLEQRGLKVWLVDARQMKYVPGRKSDVQDCQWLQKLMSLGLLRAAFRPSLDVCVALAVARQREVLSAEQARWVLRMQKSLVQMNIQLGEMLTDVMGMTGQAIIGDIVAGERDPKVLARHRHGCVKASAADIERTLTGNWREEYLFVQRQASRQEHAGLRSACDAGALGGRGSHAHQWPGGDLGADGVLGGRPRPQPLCQRQALLLLAGPVLVGQRSVAEKFCRRAPGDRPIACARRSSSPP